MTQLLLPRLPTAAPATSCAIPTDEQLMVMIQAHRHRGLDLLHDRYATLLKAMSMKVLHNDADAEDLLQDVFMEIWDRAASYDPLMGRPIAWISTLTHRRSIDRLRKRQTRSNGEDRFAEEVQRQGESWTHVHEELSHAEMKSHLQRALATLPEMQRSAINLTFHGHMSQRQIKAHTGVPLGTIKTRLKLGLRKMAACLHGFEDLLWAGKRPARVQR